MANKVRIYEWAKKHKLRSNEIVTTLRKNGHSITNHTSSIDEAILEKLFLNNKEKSTETTNKVENPKTTVRSDNPRDNSKSDNRTNNNRSDDNKKPYNKNYNRNSSDRSNTTSNDNRRPYNNNNSQGNRPYNKNNSGGNRPYNNNNGGNRPYNNNNNSGGNRPYNNNSGGNRPYNNNNNSGGSKPPYNKRPAAGGRPFNKKPEEDKSAIDTNMKKADTKKNISSKRKKQTYDRFAIFDSREKNIHTDQKTKTQLKKEARQQREEEMKKEVKQIQYSEDMTVSEFAKELGIPAIDIVTKLFELGIIATINQPLDKDAADILSVDYNVELIEATIDDAYEIESLIEEFDESQLASRPPIVTIMGHVDHGKTTLLDTIRKSNVTARESGGITQHIGAYQVKHKKGNITFLDTPGHAAFSAMRARGAHVTDITVLVVAADDGVKPQTKEAISHAKEANTPLIVAVNKMDKPDSDPERVKSELAENGVLADDWGGDVPFVKVSALKGEGIEDLLSAIELIADIYEYKAPEKIRGYGTVIEAHLDKGRGSVATIIVEGGEVNVGDPIVVGHTWGSVRVLQGEAGNRYKKITSSMPAEITGLKDVPQAGDRFVILEDAKQAQLIGEKRSQIQALKDRNKNNVMSLDELNKMISEGNVKELPIIVKADVQGSAEALTSSLEKIEVNGVKVRIVHKGVGAITESDATLALTGNAIMIGFNVRPDANARKFIEKENITLIINNIIYKIIEEIEDSMRGMREKVYREDIIGYARIDEVFKITGVGKVAGCVVTSGKITRKGKIRLIREGVVLYDGELGQLKRFKDDVSEVVDGQDCGMSIENYSDYKKGDEFECYLLEEEDLDKITTEEKDEN